MYILKTFAFQSFMQAPETRYSSELYERQKLSEPCICSSYTNFLENNRDVLVRVDAIIEKKIHILLFINFFLFIKIQKSFTQSKYMKTKSEFSCS